MDAIMSGYLVVTANIVDRVRFGAYVEALPPVYQQYGGQYLALAPAVFVTQHGRQYPPRAVVISAWPSLSVLLQFWHSKEYRQVAELRSGTGEFQVGALAGRSPQALGHVARPCVILTLDGDAPAAAQVLANGPLQILEGTAMASTVSISVADAENVADAQWGAAPHHSQLPRFGAAT
jgi:uncharacterized protein (DUF1330 family)